MPELQAFLTDRVGLGAAANHARLGTAATGALRDLVRADVAAFGQTQAIFRFFCAFAHEVMDGFGRLLCFLNRQQPSATDPEPRPGSYNERMLEAGWVTPYFIWPNIDPFCRQGSLIDAVLEPGTANTIAEQAGALQVARRFVIDARDSHLGLFEQAAPLQLLPFELRSWPAGPRRSGGSSTLAATTTHSSLHRTTSRSPTLRIGCLSPLSTCRCLSRRVGADPGNPALLGGA